MDYAKEQGIEQEKVTIAKNMLKMNFEKSDISKATGLSKKEIENLSKELELGKKLINPTT